MHGGMIGFFSTGDAAVIVAVLSLTGTWVAARNRKAIQQINRAVNHRPNGEPTLIQRVVRLEQNSSLHAEWSAQVLVAVAEQVGVDIPARPEPVTECDQ